MYNLTNYSLLFFSEMKSRLLYLLLSMFCVFFLCLYNFNSLLIQLLYPLDTLSLDLNYKSISFFLSKTFFHSVISERNSFDSLNSTITLFDNYPLFEINLINNSVLYLYVFFYFLLVFCLPLLIYHSYLFLIPSLFYYEYKLFKNFFITLIFFLYIYLYFLENWLVTLLLNVTYNQFQELYNYEFDIEFNFFSYVLLLLRLYFFIFMNLFYCLIFFFFFTKNVYRKCLVRHLYFFNSFYFLIYIFFFSSVFYFVWFFLVILLFSYFYFFLFNLNHFIIIK